MIHFEYGKLAYCDCNLFSQTVATNVQAQMHMILVEISYLNWLRWVSDLEVSSKASPFCIAIELGTHKKINHTNYTMTKVNS